MAELRTIFYAVYNNSDYYFIGVNISVSDRSNNNVRY